MQTWTVRRKLGRSRWQRQYSTVYLTVNIGLDLEVKNCRKIIKIISIIILINIISDIIITDKVGKNYG